MHIQARFPIGEVFTAYDTQRHSRPGSSFQIMSSKHQVEPTQPQATCCPSLGLPLPRQEGRQPDIGGTALGRIRRGGGTQTDWLSRCMTTTTRAEGHRGLAAALRMAAASQNASVPTAELAEIIIQTPPCRITWVWKGRAQLQKP